MRILKNYSAPTTDDLTRLKDELGYTGNQMADLAGLADSRQWRKYTGGDKPRSISAPMLFLLSAQLVLDESQIDAIFAKMRDIGAELT
ncbi:hypothetical protein [Pantoea sp. A4]|uniref:hypothetical protein n=1 Tax=Pantoea sp. A4 TaxID=1225184 RepID=UPI000366B7D1|nr:hypothetical protein [Pantoea sp. A4]